MKFQYDNNNKYDNNNNNTITIPIRRKYTYNNFVIYYFML